MDYGDKLAAAGGPLYTAAVAPFYSAVDRNAYLANDPVKAAANRIASRIAEFAGLSATLRSAGEAEVSLPASKARLAVSYII